ncbi:hypothetical protein AVEN_100091-1 [Araneus ventricosus]|uniref:Uncharacterized protein n=1 Tax=Araneus ventricosus TaxID=182803 RepID=A0A4Y2J488_ARAVE|nr:hypothetical protein AVEN_100091-1 [Araneus ventricosus]
MLLEEQTIFCGSRNQRKQRVSQTPRRVHGKGVKGSSTSPTPNSSAFPFPRNKVMVRNSRRWGWTTLLNDHKRSISIEEGASRSTPSCHVTSHFLRPLVFVSTTLVRLSRRPPSQPPPLPDGHMGVSSRHSIERDLLEGKTF